MAEREVVELDVEPGDKIEVEVPDQPVTIIVIDDPSEGPVDPITVLSHRGGVVLRRRGELLFEAGSDVKELTIRLRQSRRGQA
jgi:hypothetical protein